MWAAAFRPAVDFPCPLVERRFRVAAGVKFLSPMQSDVNEVRRDILDQRPFPCCVGYDHRDVVLAHQRNKIRSFKRRVSHFQRMTDRHLRNRLQCGTDSQLRVVAMSQFFRRGAVSRQQLEEGFKPLPVVMEVWWQLPKQRPELFSQFKNPRGKKVRQRRLRVFETREMRQISTALDRKNEILRRRLAPSPETRRPLQSVESPVDLNRVYLPRRVLQLPPVRQPHRVKHPPPRWVSPTRNPDPNILHR